MLDFASVASVCHRKTSAQFYADLRDVLPRHPIEAARAIGIDPKNECDMAAFDERVDDLIDQGKLVRFLGKLTPAPKMH